MLERVVHSSGVVAYRSPLLRERSIPHLFTTRVGRDGRELCVGSMDAGDRAALASLAAFAPQATIRSVRQVHGDRVLRAAGDPEPGVEADAVLSDSPERIAMVYTADCVPILVAAPAGGPVVAVHAGWRGLVAGIVPRAVAAAQAAGGVAAIGPCLSAAHCEMGPEVLEHFRAAGLEEAVLPDPRLGPGRGRADLRRAAVLQLTAAGIADVDVSGHCTWDHGEELPSHRRDVTHGGRARTARLGALIAPAE